MSESDIQQFIQMDGVQFGCQMMRNNSGALIDKDGRPVRYGLGNVSKKHNDQIKSSDLIGWTSVVITESMVGKTVAIFTAIEVKDEDWKPSLNNPRERAQQAFCEWVKRAGGYAGIVNSIESFRKIIRV